MILLNAILMANTNQAVQCFRNVIIVICMEEACFGHYSASDVADRFDEDDFTGT